MYRHSYEAQFTPPLSESEAQSTFGEIKQHFAEAGSPALEDKPPRPDTFSIRVGVGKSGLLREPFNDYVTLNRDGATSLQVTLTRIISHPIDFSAEQLRSFADATEKFFREATGRDVKLEEKKSK